MILIILEELNVIVLGIGNMNIPVDMPLMKFLNFENPIL